MNRRLNWPKQLALVVAASTNNVIGVNGDLPWRLPEDLKRFKAITMGKPIIMGRLTYESIGRPLPGRQNIVISRQPGFSAEGCVVVSDPAAALSAAGGVDIAMIIGGGEIYRLFLRRVQKVFLTRVHTELDGDTFFPELPAKDWTRVETEDFPASDGRPIGYSFQVYERVTAALTGQVA